MVQVKPETKLGVRQANEKDKNSIANLVYFGSYVHRHLSWQTPVAWITQEPFLIAERYNQIIGVLACPVTLPGVAWIQAFAVAHQYDPELVWRAMWDECKTRLSGKHVEVAVMPMQPWYRALLKQSEFQYIHDVIMLAWDGVPFPDECVPKGFRLRLMTRNDLKQVVEVDHEAFASIWRHSFNELENAYQQAAFATVLETEERIIGYQISTMSPYGAHLARLAVLPQYQHQGLGKIMVIDLLKFYRDKGIMKVTVNTQSNNQASLALYQHLGFRLTPEKYPVFTFQVLE